MVLFSRWADAEAACFLDNMLMNGGDGRPLVVRFAYPRKAFPGQPAEVGIVPRKLFVGQIPNNTTEEQLQQLFEPYGSIEISSIHKTRKGQDYAFVQFAKWSQAEAAMEAHNSKTRLGASQVPLIVKFAKAKRKQRQASLNMDNGGLDNTLNVSQSGRCNSGYLGSLGSGLGLSGIEVYQHNAKTRLGGCNLLNGFGLIGNGGLNGGQDLDLLGSTVSTGSSPHSLVEGLGLMQGFTAAETSETLLTRLSDGLPNSRLGFSNMDQLIDGGQQYSLPLSESFGKAHLELTGSMPAGWRNQRTANNDIPHGWKLFVGQLPSEANEEELFNLFSPIGDILDLKIVRSTSGKSRGCAFVTYANDKHAQQAITELNGKQVTSWKTLVVKYSHSLRAGRMFEQACISRTHEG